MTLVSILIVSYNVRDLLERCLRSLGSVPDDWEVIVVDNDSNDGTREMLKKSKVDPLRLSEARSRKSKVILLNNNVGFARGNIEAYKYASGEYILLLNPDTKVLPNAIETMVTYLDEHPDVAVVGAKLLNEDGSIQRSVRGFPTLGSQMLILLKLHNYLLQRTHPPSVIARSEATKQSQTPITAKVRLLRETLAKTIEKYFLPEFDYSKHQAVDQIMGASLMTRRGVIENIGFLDPGFKRIFEEVDFCFRVKEKGGGVVYLPNARIVHSKGASFDAHEGTRAPVSLWKTLVKQYYFNQGMARFFWKHKPFWQTVALVPFLMLSLCITIALWVLLELKVPLVKNREW